MKIRVWGREDECAAFAKVVKENIPAEYLRSISKYYPNRPPSTEGRIYIEFDTPPAFKKPVKRD